MSDQKRATIIKNHFKTLGFTISVKSVPKRNHGWGQHIIEWKNGNDPDRMKALVEYYFGEKIETIGRFTISVYLAEFNAAGHPITGICKKCGCTENDACISEEYGACSWAESDLCSACVDVKNPGAIAALVLEEPIQQLKAFKKSKLHKLLS